MTGWFEPADAALTAPGRLPVFLIESRHGIHYGIPPHGGVGVKVAKHHHRDETVEPDTYSRTVTADDEALIRSVLADHIPAANGRLIDARTCLYTMTPDGDFILDRAPGAANVIVASPCSGHGFKFAPVIGEILADLAIDRNDPARYLAFWPCALALMAGAPAQRQVAVDARQRPGSLRQNARNRSSRKRHAGADAGLAAACAIASSTTPRPTTPSARSSRARSKGRSTPRTTPRVRARALKVAQRLDRDGIRLGDRVATLAWNTWRHLEAWYGIMGIGAIYHTVNPRLFPDQIVWIINHAEDRVMMVDLTFLPLLEKLADKLPSIERYVVLTDAAHMPATSLRNAVPYEEWIGEVDGDFAWKSFDERTAAGMCYTSGTTGHPKGVIYSHRSNVLHSMMAMAPDAMGVACRDAVLPVVPMFHANCWGLALTSPMTGATMVMPGAKLDGPSIYELLNDYRVTFSAAVPTVWLMLLQHLEATGAKLPHLKQGGDRRLGLPARHDQDVPGGLRRRGLPRLGHDRDEPARLARFAQAGIRQARAPRSGSTCR